MWTVRPLPKPDPIPGRFFCPAGAFRNDGGDGGGGCCGGGGCGGGGCGGGGGGCGGGG